MPFPNLSSSRILFLALAAVLLVQTSWAQEPSGKMAAAEHIRQSIAEAGQQYRAGDVPAATKTLGDCTQKLRLIITTTTNPKDLLAIKTVHGALSKAYQRLELDGVELDPLPSWEELTGKPEKADKSSSEKEGDEEMDKPTKTPAKKPVTKKPTKKNANEPAPQEQVNFVRDVAPMLVSKCGRCHVNDSKGRFSMKDVATLMKGPAAGVVLFPGDAESSPIVDNIESGAMPPGGAKVTPAELNALKTWINTGAKFDPQIAQVNLNALLSNAGIPVAPANEMQADAMVAAPTGKETVSFARDIAPILLENCNGCHIDAMQRRGNLTMDTFTELLKGGDSGAIVDPKKSADSLLVQKIKGLSGARMPAGGRPPLKDEQIAMIAKWIDEGATFDGKSPKTKLASVSAQAWANAASHEELMEKRKELALQKWRRAFGKSTPEIAADAEYVVIGNVGESGVKEVLASAHEATAQVRKALKIKSDEPLAKGGVTIFAIKGRYDYTEFGKMVESRSLPSTWIGHSRRDVLDIYATILYDKSDAKHNQANLIQQLSSVWVTGFEGVPSWFSDGFGRAVAGMIGGKGDKRIKGWEQQIASIVTNMKDPKELLSGKMNEEDAAIVGYGLIRKLIEISNRKQFDALLRALEKSNSFDMAFTSAVGPLEPTIGNALGLSKK